MNTWYAPALFLCSLAMGGILFFFSLRHSPPAPGRGPSESYAVLALEEGVPDREAAAALEKALGRPAASESSQWVFLNSFEGLERVPLEDYEGRLEAFDPRRDGYADKLKNFFVRNGKRWFFIPLDQEIRGLPLFSDPAARFKKRINAALDTVPLSFSAPGSLPPGPDVFFLRLEGPGRPAGFGIILFAAAWAAAVIFPAGYRRPRQAPGEGRPRGFRGFLAGIPAERRRLLLLAPAMLPLSLWGAPGFASLALFLFLAVLSADPLKERWVRFWGKKASPKVRPPLYPFLCLSLGLPAAFILWSASSLWGPLNFLGLSLLYVCLLGIETRRNFPPPSRGGGPPYGPCRFVPLPILPLRRPGLRDFPLSAAAGPLRPEAGSRPLKKDGLSLVLPFALASCLAALFGAPEREFSPRLPPDWVPPVTEEDYRAHAMFQAGFSRRPLRQPESGDPRFPGPGYFRYTLGEDGLVERSLPIPEETEDGEIPPFPLAELSGFLTAWESREPSGTGGAGVSPRGAAGNLVSPLSALLLVFPFLAGGGRGRKKLSPYYDKRIAA